MRAREVRRRGVGPEVLLEAASLALRGELPRAAHLLCAAACAQTGAREAALELRGRTGVRELARAEVPPGEAPPERSPPAEVRRVALEGGALRLAGPRGPLAPEDAPLVQLCNAVLARAAAAEAERAWRHAEWRERSAARRRQEQAERQRRKTVHDLRAPLVVIKGYTDMLLRGLCGPLPPEVTRYLERMASAADRQRTLLEEAFPRSRPLSRGPRTLADWLASLSEGVRRWAPLHALALSVTEVPTDCPLELSPGTLERLRRAWLRAIGGSVRSGGRVSLRVEAVEGGWALESRVEVRPGRPLRGWAVLAEVARREGLVLRVSAGPVTLARWAVCERTG